MDIFPQLNDLNDPKIDPMNRIASILAELLTEIQGLRVDVQELTRTTFNVNAPGFWTEKR